MPSKLVMDRDRSANAVDAAQVHLSAAKEAVEAALAPFLMEAETVPDVALLAELFLRRMTAASAAMVEADDAHLRELADDPDARTTRDAAVEALAASFTELRQLVTGLYGPEALAKVCLIDAVPREPMRLQRAASEVGRALVSADLGPSRLSGVQVDLATWAARLDAEGGALATAMKRVAIEGREAEQTLLAKNEAIAAFDNAFRDGASLLTLLLELAGKPDLAQRVKPSAKRPGRRIVDVTEPSDPE